MVIVRVLSQARVRGSSQAVWRRVIKALEEIVKKRKVIGMEEREKA